MKRKSDRMKMPRVMVVKPVTEMNIRKMPKTKLEVRMNEIIIRKKFLNKQAKKWQEYYSSYEKYFKSEKRALLDEAKLIRNELKSRTMEKVKDE